MNRLEVLAPDGVGEIAPGDDLAGIVLDRLTATVGLADGDVVVVTSKVVSKAEGRVVLGERDDHLAAETVREVARRGPTRIMRNRLGLTMAAAGIDASNVAPGTVVLLPLDPDASARRLRAAARERGVNVGVVITDTAGRAWRDGQTDIAIGAAGLRVLESFEGRHDPHGNPLVVTAPAVADEIAGAAELAQGKLGARPCALVRGRADLVLPPDEDGPGAAALIRPAGADLFGLGAREAVITALADIARSASPQAPDPAFGAAASAEDLVTALQRVGAEIVHVSPTEITTRGEAFAIRVIAAAHAWRPLATLATVIDETGVRLVPVTP